LQAQGTTGELPWCLASEAGRLPRIHLRSSYSEEADIECYAQQELGVNLPQIFDSSWGKIKLIYYQLK